MSKDSSKAPSVVSAEHQVNGNVSRLPPESLRNIDPDEYRKLEGRLRRKIDFRLLPMIVLMYILNYLDRNNIAAARLAGLQDELKMTDVEYSTTVSILFVGYILMQIPSNMFLDKLGRPSLYLPGCMIVWGVISTATGAVQNFGGLVACRFFLGFIEAAYFPGCLFYLSSWYTRKELGFRTAILYSGSLISGAFSGLITAGITDGMEGKLGHRAWRWLFFIEGAITIAVAIVALWILPDFPSTTKWLSPQEKDMAMWRLEMEVGTADWEGSEKEKLTHGLKLAFTDYKTYILMVIITGVVHSGSVTNFFPTVVQTLGYNNIVSLLLTAPPYVLAVICTFINSIHADRTGERFWHISIPLVVAIVAFILAATTTSFAPRYISMLLMVPGVYCGFTVCLAWVSNTLPRPPAKRAAALAAINAVSNATSIWTAYYYYESAAPRYVLAMSLNCGTAAIAVIAAAVLRWVLVRENEKLKRGERPEGLGEDFRYLL